MEKVKLTIRDAMLYPNAKARYEGNDWNITKLEIEKDLLFLSININKEIWAKCSDCKLKLRPLSDLTGEEKIEINKMIRPFKITQEIGLNEILRDIKFYGYSLKKLFDYLRSINIDIDGFIEAGKAVAE